MSQRKLPSRPSPRRLGAPVAAALIGMALAASALAAPDPKQVLLEWAQGMQSGDIATIRRLTCVNENQTAQRLALTRLVDHALARRELQDAARERFAAADDRLRAFWPLVFTPLDAAAVEKAQVTFDRTGHVARIAIANEAAPTELRLEEDQWRVVVSFIDSMGDEPMTRAPEPLSRYRLDLLAGLSSAARQTAQKIQANELPDAAAAEADLMERISKAILNTPRPAWRFPVFRR